jgi:hypothetical protein
MQYVDYVGESRKNYFSKETGVILKNAVFPKGTLLRASMARQRPG